MTLLRSSLAILCCAVIVTCEWAAPQSETGSSLERALRCYQDLEEENDISNLLLDVTSLETIGEFCRRIFKLKKCIVDNEHHLSIAQNTEHQQNTRGVSTFYINVCPPGTDLTAKYKKNALCFQLLHKQIVSCESLLPDMSSDKMKSNVRRSCCALWHYKDCISNAASATCGKEAGAVASEIIRRFFQHQMERCADTCQEDCEQPKYNAPDKSPSVSEEWLHTAIANEWKKHHKSKSGAFFHHPMSMVIAISSILVIFIQLVLPK